jgi:hypothetical protein
MSTETLAVRAFGSWREVLRAAIILAIVTIVIGGATSPAQQYLPSGVTSLANAAGPWFVTVLIAVYAGRGRLVLSILLGILGFVLLNASYAVVSELRGYPYSAANFWTIVAVPAGVTVGISARWLRSSRPVLFAVAVAIPCAILLGEGVYGLTVVLSTTGPVVWIAEIVAAVVFLAIVSARRIRDARFVLLCIGLTIAGAGVFYAAFRLL